MPTPQSVRRLTLAELTPEDLAGLAKHGEDLLVERKVDLPKPPGFGAAASSMANTLGGWILIGVSDDGETKGWSRPEGYDLQSGLGEILKKQADPVPPFVAGMRQLDGKDIAVVRVFPSSDLPHIVRGKGAVYVRTSKGKEPVDDHRTMLELAHRGEVAEAIARERLGALPSVNAALQTPDADGMERQFDSFRFTVRAAPLTVTPAMSEWPLTRAAAERCSKFADALIALSDGPGFTREGPHVAPRARAVAVWVKQLRHSTFSDEAVVVADSGGVVGAQIARGFGPDDNPVRLPLAGIVDAEVHPLLTTVTELLLDAESFGRVALDMWIHGPADARYSGGGSHSQAVRTHIAGEITVPADPDDVAELARAWGRELARATGLDAFEDDDPSAPAVTM